MLTQHQPGESSTVSLSLKGVDSGSEQKTRKGSLTSRFPPLHIRLLHRECE